MTKQATIHQFEPRPTLPDHGYPEHRYPDQERPPMTRSATVHKLDWSVTSQDYRDFRPGYTDKHFKLLDLLGVGLPGQQILDLGTGTGALALPFARRGAHVTAVDIAPGQIESARAAARAEKLDIRFFISPAEDAPVEDKHFDVVSASMCWGYFDKERIVEKVRRVLRPNGLLLISSTTWLSDRDEITRGTEALIARYHENVVNRGPHHHAGVLPAWSAGAFLLKTYHQYVVRLPFTHESWRGRIRASKWIGAALPPEQAAAFDRDLAVLLREVAPPHFEIEHGVSLQIFEPV